MATKKTTTKTEAVEDNSAIKIKEENESLKSEVDALKAQIALLMSAVSNQNAPTTKVSKRKIKFVNLSVGSTVLKGTRIWRVDNQFDVIDFYEDEAKAIVNNSRNLVYKGYVYIDDAEFVEENQLAEVYRRLISVEDMRNLFDKDARTVIELYKNAEKGQKDAIEQMIVDRKLNGQEVDANIAVQIGKLCGRDLLNIEA